MMPTSTLPQSLAVLGATLGLLGCTAHSSPRSTAGVAPNETSRAAPASTAQPTVRAALPTSVAASARLDDCDVDALDSETAFDGPGWDRNRRMPRRAKASYIVHTTVLVVRDNQAAQATFRELNAAMANRLLEHDGLVGFQVAGSTRCRTARTVAVWRDARSMRAFVGSPEHAEAMRRFAEVAEDGKFTHWVVKPDQIPPTWEQARRHLSTVGAISQEEHARAVP